MKKKLHIKAHAKDRVIHRNKKSVVYRDDDTAASVVASFFTGIGIALSFVGGALVAIIIAACIVSFSYLQIVANAAGTNVPSLVSQINTGWNEPVVAQNGKTNLLILGVDTLENRDVSGVMTDTIMVLSMDPAQGSVSAFSIPRDLYLPSERTKINAVYALANQRGDAKPHLATKQVVETLTGLPIHHVMVLEIEKLGQLIDALGGLDIEVERSFTDAQFPRSDVDVRVERDPAKLYETISFTQGVEHMNGTRALQFVRSRHSTDPVEGTDDARVKRQQKVIAALINIAMNLIASYHSRSSLHWAENSSLTNRCHIWSHIVCQYKESTRIP
jgi:LCP family protein required for cell wall assembly